MKWPLSLLMTMSIRMPSKTLSSRLPFWAIEFTAISDLATKKKQTEPHQQRISVLTGLWSSQLGMSRRLFIFVLPVCPTMTDYDFKLDNDSVGVCPQASGLRRLSTHLPCQTMTIVSNPEQCPAEFCCVLLQNQNPQLGTAAFTIYRYFNRNSPVCSFPPHTNDFLHFCLSL